MKTMGFVEAIKSVYSNFANFKGRARRSEYWYFTLFNIIISFIPIVCLLGIINIIPGIAVCIRRLHDTGRRGWWLLLALVPIVNIILLVWYCQDSQPGENQWGANPKE